MTAAEWLNEQLLELQLRYEIEDITTRKEYWAKRDELFEQAKEMEFKRRKEDFEIGYNQGYLDCINMGTDATTAHTITRDVIIGKLSKKIEKEELVKFAFDFYYHFSIQAGVPTNLITENREHVERYYDQIYKNK